MFFFQILQKFIVNGIIYGEFLRFSNGFVFGAVVVGEVENGLFPAVSQLAVRMELAGKTTVGFTEPRRDMVLALLSDLCDRADKRHRLGSGRQRDAQQTPVPTRPNYHRYI